MFFSLYTGWDWDVVKSYDISLYIDIEINKCIKKKVFNLYLSNLANQFLSPIELKYNLSTCRPTIFK